MKFLQTLALGASLLAVAVESTQIPRKHGPKAHKGRPKHLDPRNIAYHKRAKIHENFYRALEERGEGPGNGNGQPNGNDQGRKNKKEDKETGKPPKPPGKPNKPGKPEPTKSVEGQACPTAVKTRLVKAPMENVWRPLSGPETEGVIELLFASEEYNLTAFEDAGAWDNTITLIELLEPNKTDTLPYINGQSNKAPERYAHVLIDIRATEEPYYQDLQVGPLPITKKSTIQPLNYKYTKGEGKQRNHDADYDVRYEFLTNVTRSIADITQDLLGVQIVGDEDDNAYMWGIDPLWKEDGRIISWDIIWGTPEGEFWDSGTLLPLGLYLKTDITGRDPTDWKFLGLFYNGIFYETVAEFRAAYEAPGFVKLKPNVDGDWAHTDQSGQGFLNDDLHPPVSIAPDGGRFQVDIEQKYVQWYDFSFYIAFTRDTGIRLYDIKYQGERIIYELGMEEALAHYAGADPSQSGIAYLDTYYGMGPWYFKLLPGFDCPTYATYLNTTYYVQEQTRTHPESLCLFEADGGFPLFRHTDSDYAAAGKNTIFKLRGVSTVGNYDYMFDYTFHIDGSIAVDVRASGYIQSAYYANNGEYGYQIHDNLSGSMHDHVINFKADIDILGTKNSISTVEFVPTKETYPWSGGKTRSTMKVKKDWIKNEDEASINWHPNNAKQYMIVNKDKKNKYGEYRGFRITPSTPPVHLTVEDSTNLQAAGDWAKHHLYFTAQKDTEPRVSHPMNSIDVTTPVVQFSQYFDGESLEQTDIVAWFNLGMHHIPHTGDLPTTVFTTAHAGMMIEPVNYNLGNPAKRTKHMVRVNYAEGETLSVEKFGIKAPTCMADLSKSAGRFDNFVGDIAVRKFPYDPRDPFFATEDI